MDLATDLKAVLATRNQDKVREIKHILADVPVELVSLDDFPLVQSAVEDGTTFEENAIKKALHVWEETGLAALADDSGLEVDALDGEPGVMSARFAGEPVSYEANNAKLVELLRGLPEEKRKARFVCVAVLVSPKGKMVLQRGEVKGIIIEKPRGTGGFGYDPVFYLPRLKKTVAELDEETKNEMSHRAKAFTALKPFIAALARAAP
jgi:XTP/dITP diphosphohydrolase